MKEQLSAYIDGEFDLDQADHLVANAKSDGEMRQAWQTYHLIGDVMRGEDVAKQSSVDAILAAIDEEPTVLAPNASTQEKLLPSKTDTNKLPAVWSVAASVAAVFFVGLMLLQDQSLNSQDGLAVEMAENETSDYLAAHQQHAPSSTAYFIQNASFSGKQKAK